MAYATTSCTRRRRPAARWRSTAGASSPLQHLLVGGVLTEDQVIERPEQRSHSGSLRSGQLNQIAAPDTASRADVGRETCAVGTGRRQPSRPQIAQRVEGAAGRRLDLDLLRPPKHVSSPLVGFLVDEPFAAAIETDERRSLIGLRQSLVGQSPACVVGCQHGGCRWVRCRLSHGSRCAAQPPNDGIVDVAGRLMWLMWETLSCHVLRLNGTLARFAIACASTAAGRVPDPAKSAGRRPGGAISQSGAGGSVVMLVKLSYGRTGLPVEFPDDRTTVIEPTYLDGLPDQAGAVRRAIEHPTGSAPPARTGPSATRRWPSRSATSRGRCRAPRCCRWCSKPCRTCPPTASQS